MADTALERLARSRGRDLRRGVGAHLLDLREERELSLREVGGPAGVDRSVLARAESGEANLTLGALAALAAVLGAEASVRLYPATGPRLRDHIQVELIETLLAALHPRWRARLEVPVYRPVRGVIDLVLVEPDAREMVGGEAHSEVRRAERQLRWAAERTDALPSATGWPWMPGEPKIGRLLLLRSSAGTREVVAPAPAMFGAAYPGADRRCRRLPEGRLRAVARSCHRVGGRQGLSEAPARRSTPWGSGGSVTEIGVACGGRDGVALRRTDPSPTMSRQDTKRRGRSHG